MLKYGDNEYYLKLANLHESKVAMQCSYVEDATALAPSVVGPLISCHRLLRTPLQRIRKSAINSMLNLIYLSISFIHMFKNDSICYSA